MPCRGPPSPPRCPPQGWQQDGGLGLTVGLLKGAAGLLCRPFVGGLEGASKLFYSLALATLGREGILGKMQARAGGAARRAGHAGWSGVSGLPCFCRARVLARPAPVPWCVLAQANLGGASTPPVAQRRVKAPGTFTEEAAEQMEEVGVRDRFSIPLGRLTL